MKMPSADRGKFGDWRPLGVRGAALNREGDLVPRGYQRQAATSANGDFFDARESRYAAQHFTHEGGALRNGEIAVLRGIIGKRQPHLRRDDVMRVEARTHLQDLP